MSLLPENIDAEARFVAERITAIAGAAGEIIVDETPISLDQGERDLLRLIRRERVDRRVDEDRLQFAVILHLQRMADGKIEIGDAVVGLQHRGQDPVEVGNSHRALVLFIGAVGRRVFQEWPEFLSCRSPCRRLPRAKSACAADGP